MTKSYYFLVFLFLQLTLWSQELSLAPSADTYINKNLPTQVFGTEDMFQIKHSFSATAERSAWIKFSIQNVTKPYEQILLKVYRKSGDYGNITIESASTNFGENNTWNNPPSSTGPITYGGYVVADTQYFDVTHYVNAQRLDDAKSVAFKLYSTNREVSPIKFASREASIVAERPVLEFYNHKVKDIILFTYENTSFTTKAGTVHSNKLGLGPVNTVSQLNKYGGWLAGTSSATGYFRAEKDCNGTWNLIDPMGNFFYSTGLNSVEFGGGIDVPKALKDLGVNTMGSWSDELIKNVPYCPRLNLLVYFKRTSKEYTEMYEKNILPVFEPEFKTFCDNEASNEVAKYLNDPWVVGYFLDNELPFYKEQLKPSLGLPAQNEQFIFADAWMKAKYGASYTPEMVTADDEKTYQGIVTDTYFKITSEAVRK